MAATRPTATRCLNAVLSRPRPCGTPKLPTRLSLGAASVRYKSGPYGYTQAKALVFPKAGEPVDVLR